MDKNQAINKEVIFQQNEKSKQKGSAHR